MSDRVLIAKVGNIFFGDDAFGVELARRLQRSGPPANVCVKDFGVRALHLAYELLSPYALVIIADVVQRGEAPGSLYVLEPSLELAAHVPDAHGMNFTTVLSTCSALGGTVPRTLLLGCEPASLHEGVGLSPEVECALEKAAALALELTHRPRSHTQRGVLP